MNREDVARVWITGDAVCLELHNGLVGKEKLSDYSRLAHASTNQRNNYTLSYFGFHWPDIDEDLSYQGFFNKKA